MACFQVVLALMIFQPWQCARHSQPEADEDYEWQRRIKRGQPVRVYLEAYQSWVLGNVDTINPGRDMVVHLILGDKVLVNLEASVRMKGGHKTSRKNVRPAYEAGTPVYVNAAFHESGGRKSWQPGWVDYINTPNWAKGDGMVVVKYLDDQGEQKKHCRYMNFDCIHPRNSDSLRRQAPPAAPPDSLHRICRNAEDVIMGEAWKDMGEAERKDMVFVFQDGTGANADEKPDCYLREYLEMSMKQDSNVAAPWVGYDNDEGRDGHPYRAFKHYRLTMHGDKKMLDEASGLSMMRYPGCYELVELHGGRRIRWGLWSDEWARSIGGEIGATHGQVAYAEPLHQALTAGKRCAKLLSTFCNEETEKAISRKDWTPKEGAMLFDAPVCGCKWYGRRKMGFGVSCPRVGDTCYRLNQNISTTHKVCCCPDATIAR